MFARLACSPKADARPWSLSDITSFLPGTDTIELASSGAVLFNEHYADLKRDSIEQTWLILEPNGKILEGNQSTRGGAFSMAPLTVAI